jgi:hypothetical protein
MDRVLCGPSAEPAGGECGATTIVVDRKLDQESPRDGKPDAELLENQMGDNLPPIQLRTPSGDA